MADPEELPEDVVRFVEEQIDSVPHIETLLLLWEAPSRTWTDRDVAARVYVEVEAARRILEDLTRRKLVAVKADASSTGYAYDPGWDPTGERMAMVARTYRRHLIRVAGIIHSKASAAVRDFARAFEFKERK